MDSNKKNIYSGMHHIRLFIGLLFLTFASNNAWCENHELIVSSQPVSCYGKSDGLIIVNLSNPPPANFEIHLLDSLSKQVGVINQNNKLPYQYPDLHAGTFKIRLKINEKATDYSVKVESPNQLKANKINIEDINGSPSNAIAVIKANPSGGAPPYDIEWSENTNNQTGTTAKNLSPGIYKCTIDDSNHCGPVSATIFLVETEIEKYLSNREN